MTANVVQVNHTTREKHKCILYLRSNNGYL